MVDAFCTQVMAPAWSLASVGGKGVPSGTSWLEEAKMSEVFGIARWNVAGMLFEGWSMPRILEESREWRRRRPVIEAGLTAISPGLNRAGHWGKGLPDWSAGGIELVVLDTAERLTDEGRKSRNGDGSAGRDHRVGDYAPHCLAGSSRIVSLRRRAGRKLERLSTAKISIKDDFAVVQHKGKDDVAPAPECVAALTAYGKTLGEGDLSVDHSELTPVAGADTLAAISGYEFHKPGAFAAAVEAWKPCLPRRMRPRTDRRRWRGVRRLSRETKVVCTVRSGVKAANRGGLTSPASTTVGTAIWPIGTGGWRTRDVSPQVGGAVAPARKRLASADTTVT